MSLSAPPTVTAADVSAERKGASQWTTPVNAWVTGVLPTSREPFPAAFIQGRLPGNVIFNLHVLELIAPRAATSTSSSEARR